jgi:bifunctional UDP-N-acetylglucosamine pyrophosphorylase/glucosamine-1-phosphate N-acetyltransferase
VTSAAGSYFLRNEICKDEVRVRHPQTDERVNTGLKRFSAVMGDDVSTGCNSVLSPGALLMPKTGVMPCVHFHGTLKSGIAE